MALPRVASVGTLLLAVVVPPSTAETILFGPESFTRGTGKPINERRTFETFGYEDPFVLHLINGAPDGGNRCSSATVALDGRIVLGPSDFSQKAAEHTVDVSVGELAELDVTLASDPGCRLTISVGGTPRLIGSEGGTVRYRNGIVLTFEPGAVADPVRVELLDLPVNAVDAVMTERDQAYRSHVKRALGGFIGRPDGLSFLAPVWATVPVLALEPGEVPVQVAVDLDARTYWITDTSVNYNGEERRASMHLRHFSGAAIAAVKPGEQPCESCSYWKSHLEECEALSERLNGGIQDQDLCCLLSPKKGRKECAPQGCTCCKEGEVRSVSASASWDSAHKNLACVMVNGELETTYLDCACPKPPPEGAECAPGEPLKFHETLSDFSIGCERDMDITVQIADPGMLLVCDEAVLQARLEAKAKDGRRLFVTEDFLPQWLSLNRDMADFPDAKGSPGLIRALAEGEATIEARALDERHFASATQRVVQRPAAIGPGSALWVEVGESTKPELSVQGLCGEEPREECLADWSSSNPTVLEVEGAPEAGRFRAKSPGTAEVTAVLKPLGTWCTAEFGDTVTVTVTGMKITGISPSTVTDCRAESVTISGMGFTAGALVRFEGPPSVSAEGVSVVSAETITARTPSNMAAGTYDVVVVGPSGETARLPDALVVRPCAATRYFIGPVTLTAQHHGSGYDDPWTNQYGCWEENEHYPDSEGNRYDCYRQPEYGCTASPASIQSEGYLVIRPTEPVPVVLRIPGLALDVEPDSGWGPAPCAQLWGSGDQQIACLYATSQPSPQFSFFSPLSGDLVQISDLRLRAEQRWVGENRYSDVMYQITQIARTLDATLADGAAVGWWEYGQSGNGWTKWSYENFCTGGPTQSASYSYKYQQQAEFDFAEVSKETFCSRIPPGEPGGCMAP